MRQLGLKLSAMPRVLNRYRDAIPPDAVNIMRPSKWGNRWSHMPLTRAAYRVRTRDEAVTAFRLWFRTSDEARQLREDARRELRGRDLVCCCAPAACHGDVLLEYANL